MIKERLKELNSNIIFYNGFDNAIIGYVETMGNTVTLYDFDKCIHILMIDQGYTRKEAIEYIDYNLVNAYLGEHTPIFANLIK